MKKLIVLLGVFTIIFTSCGIDNRGGTDNSSKAKEPSEQTMATMSGTGFCTDTEDIDETGNNTNKETTDVLTDLVFETDKVYTSISDVRTGEDQIRATQMIMEADYSKQENNRAYSADQILSFLDYCGSNSNILMYDLNFEYPIQYLAIPNNACPYCIYHLDTGEDLYVLFTENKVKEVAYCFIVNDKVHVKEDFDELKTGMSLADVETIDSGTKTLNSINACALRLSFTLHMVKGGFIKITYTGGELEYDESRDAITVKNEDDYKINKIEFIPNGERIIDDYDGIILDSRFAILEEDYS